MRAEPFEQGRTIRVLLVDDHDLYRTGLASLLGSQPDIEVVGQVSSARAGVRLARELRPDVVLIDLRMPDLDGSSATAEIVREQPGARVVALTVATDEATIGEALMAGACGFLTKDMPVEQVATALRATAEGSAWLSARAAEVVLGRLRQDGSVSAPAGEPAQQLTARELEVLRLVARGMENAEIAAALAISAPTVKNHVSSILHKLGVQSRIQAAIYAVRSGLG